MRAHYFSLAEFVWVTLPTVRNTDYFGVTRGFNTSLFAGTSGGAYRYNRPVLKHAKIRKLRYNVRNG